MPIPQNNRLLSLMQTGVLLLLLGFLTACTAVPKSLAEGEANFQRGNFEVAARMIDQAAREAPKNEDIALRSSVVNYKVAEIALRQVDSIAAQDLRTRITLYRKSRDYAHKAVLALQPLLAQPYSGPGMMDKLRRMTDSKYKSPHELQVEQDKAAQKLRAQTAQLQQEAETELETVLKETARLQAMNRAEAGSAYDDFVIYFPYAPYLSEVSDAKLEIEEATIRHLEVRGLVKIDALDYVEADQSYKRMARILGGLDRASAGSRAIASHKYLQEKNYEAAFAELLLARSIHAESLFVKNYFSKVQTLLVETRLVEIDGAIELALFTRMLDALDKSLQLAKAAEGSKVLTAAVEQRSKTLRSQIAAEFVRRATVLKNQDAQLYSSLILRNLRLARQFDPAQVKTLEALAATALGMTARKNEMKVLLEFEGSAGIHLEWARRMEADTFAVLEKAGLAGLHPFDRIALKKEDPAALQVADLVIKGRIEQVEFVETGRDIPRRRSSKYISGTRKVSNPKYAQFEAEYRQALQSYNEMVTLRQKAEAECTRLERGGLGGYMLAASCRAAISVVSASAKDSAYAKWQSTPQYLDENIISAYQYDHYTVRVNGQVRAGCVVRDNLNLLEGKCTPINEKIKREGSIIANTRPTDTEGVRDAQIDVPDVGNEQEAAYTTISKSMQAELLNAVKTHRANRYCQYAQVIEKEGHQLLAEEAYSQCGFAMASTGMDVTAALSGNLNDILLMTPEQAQRLGLVTNEVAASWPPTADVDDKALKAVKAKLLNRNEKPDEPDVIAVRAEEVGK